MNIFGFKFFESSKPAVQPVAAPPVKVTRDYVVKEGLLNVGPVDTLEQFYQADSEIERAQSQLQNAATAEKLRSKDNKKADFDPREGHVVLPEQKSEFHPTGSGYEATLERVQVKAEGPLTTITDSLYQSTAVWDRPAGTFSYETMERGGKSERVRKVKADETFGISAGGKVTLPGAGSLKEAEEVSAKRERAERAESLIQSALLWHETASAFDGKPADLNPAPGAVVAAAVDRGSLQKTLGRESVMGTAEFYGGGFDSDPSTFDSFDLQASANQFIVAGALPQYGASGVELSGTFDENKVSVVYRNSGQEEVVTWSKTDGTVRFETADVYRKRDQQ